MKKILSLIVVFLTLIFGGNAQYLLQEGFETGILSSGWITVDADGDGYNWEDMSTGVNGHNSSYCAFSHSWISATGALTPDNWLISPAVNLTSNAILTFWVCAQDANYAAEHYGVYISTTASTSPDDFTLLYEETIDANGGAKTQGLWKEKTIDLSNYTGQTVRIAFRHFNSTDMFYLNLDDVEIIAQPTVPTITANPTDINFGNTIIGNSKISSAVISTYNLTAAVTATATYPFSVSANGSTYGSTVSLSSTGDTLYIKYTPTTPGTDYGTVTLSSTGAADVTITVAGNSIDCSTITVPIIEDFESSIDCWTMVSMDPANDDRFGVYADADAYDGAYDFHFSSYSTAYDYNQWLITPELTLNVNETYIVKFFYKGYNANENFKVMYSTTNNNPTSFTMLADYTNVATSWTDVVLELPAGTKYVAIDYYSNYQYYLYIDNFSIMPATSSMSLSETALDFGINEMGSTSDVQYVVMNTISVNEPFTVTATAPFEVSLDGTTFATTQTIPANATTVVYDTIFVRFAPTTAGTFNESLTVSSTSYNGTVALTGESIDCSPGITVPYTQNFNAGLAPPTCWSIGTDPEIFMSYQIDETDYCIGMQGMDMLITPEIHATDPILVTFDYINYGGTGATAPTYFHVGYSTTDNNPTSFTWQGEQPCSTDAFESFSTIVPAGTKYVAVGASQIGTFLYWGMYETADIFIIDNFTLTAQTDALLTVSPESMSFGSTFYGSSTPVQTASVVGALLTSDINVTAPANFEVSANGTTYAATATLPLYGGTLYVRYNPTEPGNHNGTITITSDAITTTITVSGNAINCTSTQSLPFLEGFENGLPACWTALDQDGDSYTWVDNIYSDWIYEAYEGEGCVMSASYINNVGALTPDNWLISPALAIPDSGATLSWYVTTQDPNYPAEFYDVMISSSTTPDSFTSLFNETLFTDEWQMRTVNINGNWAGQTVHIAFRHHNSSDMFWMKIDNVSVTANGNVPLTVITLPASNIALTTATLNATITNPDNVTITAKGFEWKATAGGTYTQIVGSGTDNTFTANLSGLTPYTNYTYRAFITYNGYTVYGGEMTFTTTEEEAPCLLTFEMHDSYGDGWNGNKILVHNHDTIQEVTLESDNYGVVSVPVYNGALEMEWVDGSYKNECSVTITGPCLYYSCSQYEAPSGTFLSSNINCGGSSPAVPSFSYWTENTCSSVIVHFENTSTNADSVFWNIDGFTTNEWNPIHEFTESGTYPITIQAYNSSCELYGVTTQNITVTVPAPITTVLDTAVQSSDLPLTWYGHTFTGTETYTTVLQAANGCDSTATLILTGCDIASVPYFESFEGFGSFPPCWTKYSTSSNSPYISTSYHSDGAASLCFSKSSTTQQYVASDAIDVSNYNAGDLAVSFSLLPDGLSYARMDVGIMTDPNDISSFSLLKSYDPSDFTENHVWHNVSIPIMQHYSNPIYIVFYAPDYSNTYMYVDEVRVDLTPTCSAPSNLKISNIAGTSAMISWTASQYGDGSYMVEYSDNGTTWNLTTTTETTVMLTNLTPTNLYYVRVYHSCSSENSDTLYDSFTTRCLADGEISIGEGTGTSTSIPSYSFYNYGYSQQIYLASEFNGPTDITSISMNMANLSQQRNYKIYLAHTTATDLGSGWASTTGAQLVFSSPQTLVTGWNTFDFTTPFSYNGTDNLLVIFIDSTGSWLSGNSWQVHNTTSSCARYLYQDSSVYPLEPSSSSSGYSLNVRNNVKFGGECDETITCIAPNAYLSDITAESVTLNWVPGYTENSWEVEYCTDTANWISEGTVTTSPYTIDNLDANTLYTVRMRSVCGNGDYSYWVTMQARTSCGDIAVLPYTENFDSYGTGTNAFPTCWDKINTSSSNYPQISTTCFEGTGSLYFYANNGTYNIAVAPPISSEIPVNTLQANFMYRATNATDMLIVGVMTDPAYESTFVPVDTIYPASQANNWMEQRVTFDQYTGEGRFIAFKNQYTSTYCYSYIDNLVINLIETCPRPMHVAAISTPSDTVYLSWDAANGTQWDIIYGPLGFDPEDANAESTVLIQGITDNPYTITGLAGGMGYDFYVRTDCDNDDYSEWSSFPASAYPFSYAMGITGSDTVTGCGFNITDDGGPGGNYSNNCDYTLTIYPEIPDNLVSVQGTSNTEANYDYLYIYDGADATGTLLGTFNGQGWTVPELVSSTGPLTIHFHSDASVTYSGFQLTVSCISNTCPKPTDLIVSNIGMNSADLAWTPGGNETSWNVEYKGSSETTWTLVTSSTASYQLTGLTAGTNYNVRVQADCGDETSQYLATSFSTPLCEVADQCTYTFVLTDGYGDGWNGASLTVRQNNEVVSVLEAESHGGGNVASVDTVTVNLCDGVSTSLEWTSGTYDDEAGFTLIGPDGTQIYTIDDMETYTTYTFTTNCNGTIFTDPTIATEIATNVTLTTATLNATITNPDNVTITAKGFEWKATTGGTYTQIVGSGTDNTFTANLSGLTPYTNYTYRAFITYNGYTVYGGEMTFTTTEEEVPCLLTFEMHDSFGDGWNGNKILVLNHDTIQEVTLESDNYGVVSVPVYNGALEMEWVDGSYKYECAVTITGPCLYYSCSQYEAPSGTFLSSNINCGGSSPAVPSFSYWTENTCNSVIVHFENTSTDTSSASWNIAGYTTSEWNPFYEFTASGNYTVTLQAYNSSCELYWGTAQNITVTMPAPITTTLDTAVCAPSLPLAWHGHTFSDYETYTSVLQSAAGCDSTVTLTVNMPAPITVKLDTAVCTSDLPLTWHGHTFSDYETYTSVLQSVAGCDSTVTLRMNNPSSYNSLLSDDFNDGLIDPEKWTFTGNTVVEEDGQLKLYQNVTDQDVHLRSVNLNVPQNDKVTMNRRFMVHRSDNSIYGNYFYGSSYFYLNGGTNGNNFVGLQYNHTAYEDWYGTYLVYRLDGMASETRVRLCDATFDTWLTEQVEIDFFAGTFSYYLDTLLVTVIIPELFGQTVDHYNVEFRPGGWWTGHQHFLDYVKIYEGIGAVTTSPVSNVAHTTATCGGDVTPNECDAYTAAGVCWSTFQNPTLADAHTSDGSGTGAFTSALTGLEPNTTYYVRAYATNSMGTVYGEEVSFTTLGSDTTYSDIHDTITIGTGVSSDHLFPFNNYYKHSWNQMIYPAWQINEAGYITSVAFYVNTWPASNYPFSTLSIYMGISEDLVNATDSSWLPMSELTEVYSATDFASPIETGWQTFNLSTPFPYDGSGHLVIVTSKTMLNYTSSLRYRYTPGAANCCIYRRSDFSPEVYASHPGSATGYLSDRLPNLRLTIDATGDFCHAVTNLAVNDITTNGTAISWRPGSSADSNYIMQYKTNNQSWNDATTINVHDTIYDLTGMLISSTTYNIRIATNCGGDTSLWKSITFVTNQIPAQVPYFCNFENENEQFGFENGTAANKWYVDTAANNGGSHSLYVSQDQGVTNTYNNTASHVWAYRDIYFPESDDDYLLSFDWRCYGQGSYDYMAVYVGDPVQIEPNSSTQPAGSVALTTNANSSQPNFFNLKDNYQHYFTTLSGVGTGTVKRLYFYWNNDQSGSYNPAASVDNILIVPICTHSTETATACDSYTWIDGNTYTSSGTYEYYTTDSNGCATLYTLLLTINQSTFTQKYLSLCEAELPYLWYGQNITESGTYTTVLQAANGCDSMVTLTLNSIESGLKGMVISESPYFVKTISDERFVMVADYDNDSLKDIITRVAPSGEIRFYHNTGSTFSYDYTLNSQPYGFAPNGDEANNGQCNALSNLADFDNDGVTDLLVYGANHSNCSANSVRIYWGSATHPYFNDTLYTELEISSPFCVGAYGVDLNNDGLRDVFIRNCGVTNLYMNNGNRSLTHTNVINTGRDISVIFDDYDQDGDADLCYTKNGWADGQWGMRLNMGNGDGTFSGSTISNYDNGHPLDGFLNFQANPLDNNIPDIAFTCSNDGTNNSTVYIGQWDGTAGNFLFNTLNVTVSEETRIVQAFDLDGDGYDDIIIRSKTGESYTTKAYINDGHGNFTHSVNILENSPYYPYEFHRQGEQILMAAYHGISRDQIVVYEMVPFVCDDSVPAIPPGDALPCPGHETVTDYDGNVYNTVKIGEQCWMKENLRVTHYEDGTALVLGTTTSDTEPYYYDYSSSPIPLADRGYLYNWLAVMHGTNSSSTNPSNVQGVCPDGWHVPSYEEWTQLASYVSSQNEYTCAGNSSDIAKALASTEGWDISSGECYPGDQSVHANNTTGFSGIPAGYYRNGPSLSGSIAIFWSSSSSDSNPNGAFCNRLSCVHSTLNVFYNSKSDGHSVRCVLGDGCTTQNTEFSETSCGDYTWNGQTYTQTGDYTQTFTTSAGCDSVVTLHLTVNATPVVTVTASETILCEGGTVTLTASVEPQTTYNYQWYKNVNGVNTLVSDVTSDSYTTSDLLSGNSYEFYLVATNSISGCSTISNSVPVNVITAPTVTIQGANTTCEGGNLILNAFVSSGGDGASYNYTWNWTGPTSGYFVSQNPSFIPNLFADPVNPYYFTVTISRNDNMGCTATSATHEVNVLAVPTVTITADNNYVCQNGDVTFTAHVLPVGSYDYVWTINGQQQAVNSATVTISATTIGNINAQVVVSSAYAGCSATVTLDNPVHVVAAPTLTLSADHSTMCAGGTTTLSATVNASPLIPNNFNYEWIVDNGTPIPGVTSSYDLTLNAAGIHTIQARISQNDSPGCTSDLSYPIIVQVAEQPIVSLSPVDNNTICEGGSITLDATVSNYNNTINGVTNSGIYGVLTFDWYDNGVAVTQDIVINNATNQQIYTLNTVGDHHYSVAVTTSGHNCLTQVSNNEDVSVVNDPSWTNVSVSGSNNSHLCIGETISLTAWIQGGVFNEMGTDGYIQWMVTDANGMTSNVTSGIGGNAYDIPSDTGTFVYTPTYIGDIGYGCQLTNPDDALVEITVSPLPTARFTSGNGTQLCDNDPNASAQLTIEFTGVPPFSCQIMDNYHNITTYFSTPNNNYSFYVAPSVTTSYHINQVTDLYCIRENLTTDAYATVYVFSCEEAEVVTRPVENIDIHSASGGGVVVNSGGSNVTARGVCWCTSQNPTIADAHTTDGSGTGEFSSSITGLAPNTTYHVRAYATNSVGTSYGQEETFTTNCDTVDVNINENPISEENVTLTAQGAENYIWSNGQDTPSITVSPAETTIYSVTGTDIYGCWGTASVTVNGSPHPSLEGDAIVFPNPTTGIIRLLIADTIVYDGNNDIYALVYNSAGIQVLKTQIYSANTELDLGFLNPDIYFLELDINGIKVKEFKIALVRK